MRRYPRPGHYSALPVDPTINRNRRVGFVLSGGGARGAYQVGALRALYVYDPTLFADLKIILGSSVGAINGLILGACLNTSVDFALEKLSTLWLERTYRNTFLGSPTRSFFTAIQVAVIQYLNPGPSKSDRSIFDPSPLRAAVEHAIAEQGGVRISADASGLDTVGIMTTVEGKTRRPLLFAASRNRIDEQMAGASFEVRYVNELNSMHAFASAALPSVLPPVSIDTEEGKIRLVDGGISQNIPVDPAVRFGADQIIILDISGREWWFDRYGESRDTRPKWEVPAEALTYCFRPPETLVIKNQQPFGPLLKQAVGKTTGKFIKSLGPIWPIFELLRRKLGEEVAYETVSYAALDPEYLHASLEQGFYETLRLIEEKKKLGAPLMKKLEKEQVI